jgi:hypothetical protein
MIEEKKKEYELLEKELKEVNKMINVTDIILKKTNKHIDLIPSDIIGNDQYHSYIGIKSNDNISPNIKIIDEDDLDNKNLNINTLEEKIKEKLNLKLHLHFDNKNNNDSNDYLDKKLYDNNLDNKTQLYSDAIKGNNYPPIELCLISPQDRTIDYSKKNL